MEVETKTSDEILEELFNALNVPLSPKTQKHVKTGTSSQASEQEISRDEEHNSESEDKDVDSRSSESEDDDDDNDEEDVKKKNDDDVKKDDVKIKNGNDDKKTDDEVVKIKVDDNEEPNSKSHKHKSSKRKKEKKKKKKKRKKKDDESHKSRKKHRKSSSDSDEEPSSKSNKKKHRKDSSDNSDEEKDYKSSKRKHRKHSSEDKKEDNSSKDLSADSVKKEEIEDKTVELKDGSQNSSDNNIPKTKSSPNTAKSPKTEMEDDKVKSECVNNESECKEMSKNHIKKLESPKRISKNVHSSRSRSSSRKRHHRHSRSRSKSRLKSSKSSRSRSRSYSRNNSRRSRSRSRSRKSYSYRSRVKSPHDTNSRRKSSRSYSRSLSPKQFKRRLGRSRSRSLSRHNSRRKSSRSYSKSLSPKVKSRRRKWSRSPSPRSKLSQKNSRSRSKSLKRSSSKETSLVVQPSTKLGVELEHLKKTPITNIDLKSIPTPVKGESSTTSALSVALESIPLPIPSVTSDVPDPSSIPLPQSMTVEQHSSQKESNIEIPPSVTVDLGAIPVPGTVTHETKDQENQSKTADVGSEKGKGKMIIIKSLKDSLIYKEAQEEAERRAKEKHDDEDEDKEHGSDDENGDINTTDITADGEISEENKEEDEKSDVKDTNDDKVKNCIAHQEVKFISEKEIEKNSVENLGEISDIKNDQVLPKIETQEEKKAENNGSNGIEDGEIVSEGEQGESKSHKKKKKEKDKDKDKEKSKEKKKDKKDKAKDRKKRSRDRSRSRDRRRDRSRSRDRRSKSRDRRSRSRSKDRSRHKSSRIDKDRDSSRRRRKHSRSRSHSRDRYSRSHRRSYSRSRSRSRSSSKRKRDCVSDLRDKVTRKRLLEIARRNAVYLMQNGCLPPSVEQEQLVKIKTEGKSVAELTDFCKQLVATGNYSDVDLSDPSLSSEEDNDNPDKPFNYTRHPFNVKDSKPILMNIRNAPMLPTKTNAERLADHAKLREQFPVSSGSHHRTKGEVAVIPVDDKRDSGWVPVSPKSKESKQKEDLVFPKEDQPNVDISQIVSSRLSAIRKLQDNPHDIEAIKTLHNVQKDMQTWALSKQEPGQFTGSTGAKILSQEELAGGQQAWARKVRYHVNFIFIL